MFADVVFPIKVPPLTYKVPSHAPQDLAGRVVVAPLMGRDSYGLVVEVNERPQEHFGKEIKEIKGIYARFASEPFIAFIKWLSEYYLAAMGMALKTTFFEEFIEAELGKKRNVRTRTQTTAPIEENPSLSNAGMRLPDIAPLSTTLGQRGYSSYLYHAPSMAHELLLIEELLRRGHDRIRGAIILVPEIYLLDGLVAQLSGLLKERICCLHSKLNARARGEAIKKIIAGEADIVVGTRSALFAPLPQVSFIAALCEHNPSYKAEEGIRYHGRDSAVMRAYLEKAPILLSSICPSLESAHNCMQGKYMLLSAHPMQGGKTAQGEEDQSRSHFPKIQIVPAEKRNGSALALSQKVRAAAKKVLAQNESMLFLINRKGYSLLRCEECGGVVKCERCRVPFIFSKESATLRCPYCGSSSRVDDTCSTCHGSHIAAVGSGTERVKEELEQFLNAEALLMERGRAPQVLSSPEAGDEALSSDVVPFVVGTSYATRKVEDRTLSAAAFLNVDMLFARPDFRAHERTFQEVMQAAQLLKPNGALFLQTWFPRDRILQLIKRYDFEGFYRHELAQRKVLSYPPFSKFILISLEGKKETEALQEQVRKTMQQLKSNAKKVELYGPVFLDTPMKPGMQKFQIMMKSKESKALHQTAREVLDALTAIKGLKVAVDVDPLRL